MKIYYTQPSLRTKSSKTRLVNASFNSSPNRSNFSRSIFSWIESNNNFYFQLIGIFILTVGMVLSLQNFLDGTKLSASAKENSDVRILTNFKQSTKNDNSSSSLKEVVGAVTTPESISPSSPVAKVTNFVEYTVKTGDTLVTLASKFKVDVQQILTLNPTLSLGSVLTEGTKIKIPFE